MICAYCKADIEYDSYYCDQCGEEIYICEKCGKPGKGKRCTEDGGKLIAAKDKNLTSSAQSASPNVSFNANNLSKTANTNLNINSSSNSGSANLNFQDDITKNITQPTINAGYSQTLPNLNAQNASEVPNCVIINKSINATLQISNGDIIGRKVGNFKNIFANYNQISGTHAQFNYDSTLGWTVTDLGSSNGTKYQGQILTPNVPTPIKDKTYIIFANIEFFVQISGLQSNNISSSDSDRTIRL